MTVYSAKSPALSPVTSVLPPDAMEAFLGAANGAAQAGEDHNACVQKGWAEVKKAWQRPRLGKVWVRKDDPGAGDVHVDAPLGSKAPKKPKAPVQKDEARSLKPLDAECAHTPFPYDANALAHLRSDQKPRFFGALTNPEALDEKTVPVSSLVAMQNRVDPKKVEAMRGSGAAGKPPVVVGMNGRNYIADGHHRATAAYLDGADDIEVKFKDLDPEDNALKRAAFETTSQIVKVDDSLGLVFGWAIVCKKDGEDYYDLQGDHIPEDAMTQALCDFMMSSRVAKDMHAGDQIGDIVFAFPMSEDVAKSLGIVTKTTGALIAMKPAADVLQKFRDGTYTGFSIGGRRLEDEEIA